MVQRLCGPKVSLFLYLHVQEEASQGQKVTRCHQALSPCLRKINFTPSQPGSEHRASCFPQNKTKKKRKQRQSTAMPPLFPQEELTLLCWETDHASRAKWSHLSAPTWACYMPRWQDGMHVGCVVGASIIGHTKAIPTQRTRDYVK